MNKLLVAILVIAVCSLSVWADEAEPQKLSMANELLKFTVDTGSDDELLLLLESTPEWAEQNGSEAAKITFNGSFVLNLMWTGWRAPGYVNNAENPVLLDLAMFDRVAAEIKEAAGGLQQIKLVYSLPGTGVEVRLVFELSCGSHFVRQKLSVRDTKNRNHFLREVGMLSGDAAVGNVLKRGGFGSPVAFTSGRAGAFAGIESPLATALLSETGRFSCYQVVGEKIGPEWQEYDSLVIGMSPDNYVKLWFKKYLETIKAAPAKPYLLYNSWYDVRSPEYTDRPEDVMNETNVMRIINDFKREMYEERGLKLDAFVLDDGWDIYKSDWVLRPEEFPNGLKPISDALAELDADLGIWFGPTGGYSKRQWRIEWMREHGYETVNDQFCVAGSTYKDLLLRRTTEFTRDHGVGFFKWDGIQFSCSEEGHGHPVGIYSRAAVMDAVIELCEANRAIDPDVYLNITSGTWLSPWWLRYANQIWMQGYDYGYADVPSISKRDAAITYRDVVLYEDFIEQNSWFPISHLMTHGIIKGHLQKLGGEAEPLDKFTDNALLYFARGVSMYELYISPNLLTDGEWEAIAKSIRWAKANFDTLKQTEMIGGDPGEGEAYGYAHFAGDRGIVALRNPGIEKKSISFVLDPAHGFAADAKALVMDRVYPARFIMPVLYESGSEVAVELAGYETAVFEIYPLESADFPLVAGVDFTVLEREGEAYSLAYYRPQPGAKLLNPQVVASLSGQGSFTSVNDLRMLPAEGKGEPVNGQVTKNDENSLTISLSVAEQAKDAMLALLLQPTQASQEDVAVEIVMDGRAVEADITGEEGSWQWLKVPAPVGDHTVRISLNSNKAVSWSGTLQAWTLYYHEETGKELTFQLKKPAEARQLPPRAWKPGVFRSETKLGAAELTLEKADSAQ